MISCRPISDLSCIRCPYWGIFPFQRRFADLHGDYMFDDRWFHVVRSPTWHTFDAILGVYFRFEGDLRIFTEVTCATIEDFTSFVLRTCCAPDATLGYIFHCRWDLWFFTDVACSMIDDFMMPDLRPLIRSMPYWGILPFWMRFTDLGGVAYLSPFARDVCRDTDLFVVFTMIPPWGLLGVA